MPSVPICFRRRDFVASNMERRSVPTICGLDFNQPFATVRLKAENVEARAIAILNRRASDWRSVCPRPKTWFGPGQSLAYSDDRGIILYVELSHLTYLLGAPAKNVADLLVGKPKENKARGVSPAHVMRVLFPAVRMPDVELITHQTESMAETAGRPAPAKAVHQNLGNSTIARPCCKFIQQPPKGRCDRNNGTLRPPPTFERHTLSCSRQFPATPAPPDPRDADR